MTLLASPRPETISDVDFSHPEIPQDRLSVGIRILTHTSGGLKLLHPVKVIGVVLDKTNGDREWSFGVPPEFARSLAAKMIEFADMIEGEKS